MTDTGRQGKTWIENSNDVHWKVQSPVETEQYRAVEQAPCAISACEKNDS
jgi:hypothetical protein